MSIHQDGDSQKAGAKRTSPRGALTKQKNNYKACKKVATPSKRSTSSSKRAIIPAIPKSPSPRKKGNVVRAVPIQLEGPEFRPFEEPIAPASDLPSLTALGNAHRHAINQLSLAKMRQMNLEGGVNNYEVAEKLLAHVNEANAHFFLTDASL